MTRADNQIDLEIAWPKAGSYVLAVSGGADSIVLLDLMARAAGERGYDLTVAHFDHGLREDSRLDRELVERAAKAYGLEVVARSGQLGAASEDAARVARYDFLDEAAAERGARVVTAHHQDDVIETSLLNLARGTGRRGLTPFLGNRIVRPLLAVSRRELREYAAVRGLVWREDPTNLDLANPRNFLRHELLARADEAWKQRYLAAIGDLAAVNVVIEWELDQAVRLEDGAAAIDRTCVRDASLTEVAELLVRAAWRVEPGIQLGERLVMELALFAKTGRPGDWRPVRSSVSVRIMPDIIAITP